MSYLRKHPKTLRDITFMACLSSKSSSPARALWEGTAGGHAHTTAHTLCSVVWTPHPKMMFLFPAWTSRACLQSWSSSSTPCFPSFDNLETFAKISVPGEMSVRHPSLSSTTAPQKEGKEKKEKKKFRHKLSFGYLCKRKTWKNGFSTRSICCSSWSKNLALMRILAVCSLSILKSSTADKSRIIKANKDETGQIQTRN